jgi:hypothetical protein
VTRLRLPRWSSRQMNSRPWVASRLLMWLLVGAGGQWQVLSRARERAAGAPPGTSQADHGP